MSDEDKRVAVGMSVTLSSQLMTAALAIITLGGGLIGILVQNRDVGLFFYIVVGLSFLAFVFSIFIAGKGISISRESGFRGNWRLDDGKRYFNAQAISCIIGLTLFIVAAFLSGKPQGRETSQATEPFAFLLRLPPFDPGSADLTPSLASAIARLVEHLAADKGITSIVVIGRADRRELRPDVRRKYATNWGLAQQRGARVEKELLRRQLPPSKILVTSAGPLLTSESISVDKLDCDRAASVFIFGTGTSHPWTAKILQEGMWPQCEN